MESNQSNFFIDLPKVELHAHLNGSLSQTTVVKLIKLHQHKWPEEEMPEIANTFIENGQCVGYDEPFAIFPLLHSITDNPEAVRIATCDVIRDFYDDGVKYLELRSTPRAVSGRMDCLEYCESVISGIKESTENAGMNIIVTFLLSIDRRKMDVFDSTVQLYLSLKEKYPNIVVGLDISGDPRKSDLTEILSKFKEVKSQGIKLTVHLAETPNIPETLAFLKCRLDRIGHGVYIHPLTGGEDSLLQELISSKTPVEVCLTSNSVGGIVSSFENSPAKHLKDHNVPIILCTDDKGLFSCTLSGEYEIASKYLAWNHTVLYELSRSAIDHIFASDEVKNILRKIWDHWKSENPKYF